jgi:hypothetical protein
MKKILYLFSLFLFSNLALATNEDTVFVSIQSNEVLMFEEGSSSTSFAMLIGDTVHLLQDKSLFSGVVLADLTKTSQSKSQVNKCVFIGDYENGVIQTHITINFTFDEFPKNQQEMLQAALILANKQSFLDVYKLESGWYSVSRKNYRTDVSSHLSIQIEEFSEDTASYREITRDGETTINRIIEFSDNIRHECTIKKANKCIINIEGEGIIYLDLKGRVITKEEFLMISKEIGSSSITRRYFSCDNEGYAVIFAFVKTRYKKSSSIKSILKKRYKLDKRLKNG